MDSCRNEGQTGHTGVNPILFSISGYNAPYLSVFSENSLDIFDVRKAEWIQTIFLKKVAAMFSIPQTTIG